MQALNIYGWGTFSDVSIIKAVEVPSQPLIATATASGTDVVISWVEPASNGDDISSYDILIKQSDGAFSNELTYCNGSSEAIVTATACSIPFTVLRSTPYDLAFGDLVQVRVGATNSRGASEYSQENSSGAAIQVPPSQITTLDIDPSTSSVESIGLVW